jgi:hypothetical protein
MNIYLLRGGDYSTDPSFWSCFDAVRQAAQSTHRVDTAIRRLEDDKNIRNHGVFSVSSNLRIHTPRSFSETKNSCQRMKPTPYIFEEFQANFGRQK